MASKGNLPLQTSNLLISLQYPSPSCRYCANADLFYIGGRQSPDPESQDPKQGKEASASGSVDKDNKEFDKASDKGKEDSKKTLESLESNPDRPARV